MIVIIIIIIMLPLRVISSVSVTKYWLRIENIKIQAPQGQELFSSITGLRNFEKARDSVPSEWLHLVSMASLSGFLNLQPARVFCQFSSCSFGPNEESDTDGKMVAVHHVWHLKEPWERCDSQWKVSYARTHFRWASFNLIPPPPVLGVRTVGESACFLSIYNIYIYIKREYMGRCFLFL